MYLRLFKMLSNRYVNEHYATKFCGFCFSIDTQRCEYEIEIVNNVVAGVGFENNSKTIC